MKRYQIFISSTFTDLRDERSAVIESILKLRHIPVGMEQFVATNDSQFNYIKKVIDYSDYYILIIGNRYGTIAGDVSYTEKEFDYALSKGVPILAFVHSNPNSLSAEKSETIPKFKKKLDEFRQKAAGNNRLVTMSKWETADTLAKEVVVALTNAFSDNPRPGWERVSNVGPFKFSSISIKDRYGCKSIPQVISMAKHEVFISGIALQSLIAVRSLLAYRKDLEVRLLVLNLDNTELLKPYEDMRGYPIPMNPPFLAHLKYFSEPHIKIKAIDSIMPVVFLAADMKTDNGYIKAQHYFNNCNHINLPNIELLPSNGEWYNIYKEQIEKVWGRAKPWN